MEILNFFLRFLSDLGIEYSFKPTYLENLTFLKNKNIPDDKKLRKILINIILDKYEIYRPKLKHITSKLLKKENIHLSSLQKDLIEKYLCYKEMKYLEKVLYLEEKKHSDIRLDLRKLKQTIDNYIYPDEEKIALNTFINYFKEQKRKDDILTPIFSRLLYEVYLKKISFKDFINLIDISKYNNFYPGFIDSLPIDKYKKCNYSDLTYYLTKAFKKTFLDKKSYHLIILEITQEIYDIYKNYENFIQNIFKLIKFSYDNLNNHRYLNIYIGDIIDETGINIRWKVYSDIIIFATKFKIFQDKEKYKYFYKPNIIYEEYASHLKSKYEYKLNLNFEEFEYFNYGFKYIDTLILDNHKRKKHFQTNVISNLENLYDIAIILEKKEFNFNPIPCPACSSLQVSGNSFPEIGTRSWECKNPMCPERSKTNRGKRFSEKIYITQDEEIYKYKENLIDKSLLNTWRKDVVKDIDFKDFIEMSIKYYSLVDENVFILTHRNLLNLENFHRNLIINNFSEILPRIEKTNINKEMNNFNNFLSKFIKKEINLSKERLEEYLKNIKKVKGKNFELYNGDSYIVLQTDIKQVNGMVTSPPYYNAREYSTWNNIYLYLFDMFQILIKANNKLKPHSIFLFNIGDVNDNENIIKSKMGESKIPLGAYLIKLFEKAGFCTLDCIIWSKGEPESNRHFNQGNYIPFFQKPLNAFEYIFIFYKKDKYYTKFHSVKNINSNIHEFSPIIKIIYNGTEKINKIGHTAPFPEEIPNLLIDGFLSNEKNSLMDPFAGIGTSVITGLKRGNYAIGIELNKEYFERMYKNITNLNIK